MIAAGVSSSAVCEGAQLWWKVLRKWAGGVLRGQAEAGGAKARWPAREDSRECAFGASCVRTLNHERETCERKGGGEICELRLCTGEADDKAICSCTKQIIWVRALLPDDSITFHVIRSLPPFSRRHSAVLISTMTGNSAFAETQCSQ